MIETEKPCDAINDLFENEEIVVQTDRYDLKLIHAKSIDPKSLRLTSYVKVLKESEETDSLLESRVQDSPVFFLSTHRACCEFLLIPVHSDGKKGENYFIKLVNLAFDFQKTFF